MANEDSEGERGRQRFSEIVGYGIGIVTGLVLAGLAVGAVGVVYRAVSSGPISPTQDPFKTIFASRLVVASMRLAILFAAGYVVLSILARIRRGEWLSRIGPAQVSESVQTVTSEGDYLSMALAEALDENERLQGEVGELTERLEALDTYLDQVLDSSDIIDDEVGDHDVGDDG